ncbi:hypothetical protein [Rubrobacter indicoceani]|uniref:hypothetical protein n=1 Tax=Rubrobacter indicoceani TaxID=2051957 RepID=UPI000E5BA585|nr:hypothetical protein [Rubrobacter indicoceani]
MTDEAAVTGGIVPGLIVRHTSRRLGKLGVCEACGRLVEGKISFSEFVDQVGDGFREVLDFMMEYDLHPGRPEDVLFAVECHATSAQRQVLLAQLGEIHENALHLKAG